MPCSTCYCLCVPAGKEWTSVSGNCTGSESIPALAGHTFCFVLLPTFFTLLLQSLNFYGLVKTEVQGCIVDNEACCYQGWSHCSGRTFVCMALQQSRTATFAPGFHTCCCSFIDGNGKDWDGLRFFPSPCGVHIAVFWVILWLVVTRVQLTSLAGICVLGTEFAVAWILEFLIENRVVSGLPAFRIDWKGKW